MVIMLCFSVGFLHSHYLQIDTGNYKTNGLSFVLALCSLTATNSWTAGDWYKDWSN